MPKFQTAAGAALALSIGLSLSAPAHAVITNFATASAITGATNFGFKNAASNNNSNSASLFTLQTPNSNVGGSTFVDFSFINLAPALDSAVDGVEASFTFNALTQSSATTEFGFEIQPGIQGNFRYISTKAILVGNYVYAAGSNLLSGQFVDASLDGRQGSTVATMEASDGYLSTLILTSDFIDLSPSGQEFADFGLQSITPSLGHANGTSALKSFKANGSSAEFSIDPAPTVNGVPEPATWAVMLVGFGGVGAAMRARRKHAAKA
jgi:hypothetical protein